MANGADHEEGHDHPASFWPDGPSALAEAFGRLRPGGAAAETTVPGASGGGAVTRLCDCDCSTPCPNGRSGSMPRCEVEVRKLTDLEFLRKYEADWPTDLADWKRMVQISLMDLHRRCAVPTIEKPKVDVPMSEVPVDVNGKLLQPHQALAQERLVLRRNTDAAIAILQDALGINPLTQFPDLVKLCKQLRSVAAQLRDAGNRTYRMIHVPGMWRCGTCEFVQVEQVAKQDPGQAGNAQAELAQAANDHEGHKCPNCLTRMSHVTERDNRIEMSEAVDQLVVRNANLKAILRVNLLRWGPPGITHEQIDNICAGGCSCGEKPGTACTSPTCFAWRE